LILKPLFGRFTATQEKNATIEKKRKYRFIKTSERGGIYEGLKLNGSIAKMVQLHMDALSQLMGPPAVAADHAAPTANPQQQSVAAERTEHEL
jgi:hypothetical protein